MKKAVFLFLLLSLTLIPSLTAEVYLADVDGTINAGVSKYLERVIERGNRENAELIVINLNTPGGLLTSTENIVEDILNSDVETVVFIHKEGGWAYSAGTYLLMASDVAVMHPHASVGAAQPKPEDNKTTNAMVSWISTLAERKNRNSSLTKKFVSENLALSGKEALEKEVIEYTARDLPRLLSQLNVTSPEIKKEEMNPQEKIFSVLSHPQLVSLIFLVGILGIFFIFKTGDLELSFIPLVALIIAFWSFGTIQFSWMGAGLILLGLGLLFLEILEPGLSIFGIGGTITILLGFLTIDAEPLYTPSLFNEITMFVLGMALAMIIFFLIVAQKVSRSLREKVKTGAETLIGKKGEVIEKLDPRGRVKVNGETWAAVGDKKIGKEEKVKILKVDGNTLKVKKV